MAFIPVTNTAKLVMRFSQFDKVYTNTTYWRRSGAWTVATLNDLATSAYLQWENWILGQQAASVVLLGPVAYDMSAVDAPVVEYSPASVVNGGLASPALPGNVTLSVSLRTAGRGRSARGRIYHVGLTEGQVVDNQLGAGVATTLAGVYNSWWADMEIDNSADWGVVSFQLDGAVRNPGVFQLITNLVVDDTVDTQRRRVRP